MNSQLLNICEACGWGNSPDDDEPIPGAEATYVSETSNAKVKHASKKEEASSNLKKDSA